MTPNLVPGAWYGDYLPTGEWVATIPNVGLWTHLGNVGLPPGEPWGLGFPRCTAIGGFRFAGQAHTTLSPACWEWDPTTREGWVSYGPPCHGTQPTIYDREGVLHRSDGRPGVWADGYRYVTPENVIVSCNSTIGPFHGLFEYTQLAADCWIGHAAYDGGGLQVLTCDEMGVFTLRQGPLGDCRFVNANRDGDVVAIAFSNEQGVVLIMTTMVELRALPPVVPPPVVEPIGPRSDPRPADGRTYDLLAYILGDAGTWPRKGPTHPMHQRVVGDLFHFVKFHDPGAYETWAYDANWIYHLEDASSNPPYSFLDPRWFPRVMQIGEAHGFDSGPHETQFRDRASCAPVRREPFGRKMWLHAVYDRYYWGPDLGERETIVVAYDPTGGFHGPGRSVELGFYAKGAGSCRWESYGSEAVYENGPAHFPPDAMWARSDFYLLGGQDLGPKLTGCVPQVCPHLPPWQPRPLLPQSGDIMQFLTIDSAKVVPYKALKPSSRSGCTNVILPNGNVFSGHHRDPEGTNERPAGTDGPWEQGQVNGSEITYHIDGQYYSWLLVPVDKVS